MSAEDVKKAQTRMDLEFAQRLNQGKAKGKGKKGKGKEKGEERD